MSTVNLNRGTWGVDPVTGQPWAWLRDDVLEDRRRLATGTTSYRFFTNRYDQVVTPPYTLTRADTNMSLGTVPDSQKWYLWNLGIGLEPPDGVFGNVAEGVDQAFRVLMNNSYIVLRFVEEEIFRVPASIFGARPITTAISSASAVDPGSPVLNAAPVSQAFGVWHFTDRVNGTRAAYPCRAPYVLEANTNWSLELVIEKGAGVILAQLNDHRVSFGWERTIIGLSPN